MMILLLSVGFVARKAFNEQWNRALLFRSYVNYEGVRASIALHSTVRPGSAIKGDAKVVELSGSAWAHLSHNSVQWMSGTELSCQDKVFAISGDPAKKLFQKIGYPDRMISATNGADLVYFVGANREFLLKVIAIENLWGELVLYRFTMGRSSDPILLLDIK